MGDKQMSLESKYVKIIEWSDEDGCFIGSCPELFYGGCHGDDERKVFDHLCRIIEDAIDLYNLDGKPLPKPMAGRDLVTRLQSIA